jgi:hypothetical protein
LAKINNNNNNKKDCNVAVRPFSSEFSFKAVDNEPMELGI